MRDKVKDVANRIKGLRLLAGFSEEQMAAWLSISKDSYIRYENGEDDIPISIIYEIANIHGVDLTDILTGVSPKLHEVCYVKKGEGLSVERLDEYEFEDLAYKYANRKIEPLLVTLDPKNNPELVIHQGQEFNYCLEGKMKVIIGDKEYELNPGDALYFNPAKPHKMVALDGKPAKFLTVIIL
ncbi:transcriptional regulator, XRE family [Thermincola ferriacetica]|uniref:Transcriptional regulator, XRE family n=1 Tax=Thermincola ferriacetica TaxID=281456 RepID=A0A0L6W4G9_9FIRM|nr:cupin domain-containing protein [Thermincola ferriacetica]KNZ69989.1 transcriptional regulator, XRE family [Thermincola ferriacetica]